MATLRELTTRLSFTANTSVLERVAKGVDGITTRLNALIGIQALRGLAAMAEGFGTFAQDLQNTAAAAGLGAGEFQKLAYAATQSGVSQEELGRTLGNLNKKLQDARLGGEGAALAFARAGVSPEQIGSFRNAEDALYALGRGLNNIQDPVLRASAAQETLGEAGLKLLGGMHAGADGLQGLSHGAAAAAAVIDDKLLDNLVASERAAMAMRQQFKALGAQLLGAVAPAVTQVLKAFSGFVTANQALIRTNFKPFTYAIGYAMGYARGVLEDVLKLTAAVIRQLVRWGEDTGLFRGIANDFSALGQLIYASLSGIAQIVATVMENLAKLTVWFEHLDLRSMHGLTSAFKEFIKSLEGLAVTGIVGSFTALYSVLDGIWVLLTGKDLENTWIGKLLTLVHGVGNAANEKIDASLPTSIISRPMAQAQQMVMMQQGPMASPAFAPTGQAAAGAPQVKMVTNAPVTINLSGSADAKPVLQAVRDGIADHHEQVLKQAQAAIPMAVVY